MLPKLVRKGLRKGVLEGSRPWMAVGVAAGVFTIVRRAAANKPETVMKRTLQPGEGLIVRVREPAN
ncbi:MAG TPA: hypothetical protein VI916_11940 [Acidimicrobiia bacterium]|nr:hypothetical protein [Acidimicrobiia bacterium]